MRLVDLSSPGGPSRHSRAAGLTAVIGVALLVLAGCAAKAPGSAAPVATSHVDLPRSYKFEPAAITVPLGTTVTWTNDDQFSHSVSFPDGQPQLIAPGQSTSRTFSQAGSYAYVCSLHPRDMQGVVVVTAP
jgi:plastocyanin